MSSDKIIFTYLIISIYIVAYINKAINLIKKQTTPETIHSYLLFSKLWKQKYFQQLNL